jgi:antitoxin component YwqK of YwqJK toxin-antitoxin module
MKKRYVNGQKAVEQKGNTCTYYYKNGLMRAKGKLIDGQMQGKWTFNRESGKLWGTGHFKNNKKHGLWLRYDRKGKEEYRAKFSNGKLVSKEK